MRWRDRRVILHEWTAQTRFDRHYVYHPAWAIRKVLESPPEQHVDVGSILGFVAAVSACVPVRFYDYRPADLRLPGLTCLAGDLLDLPLADDSVPSLSCMHVVEHIGLGRYGDPIDPEADLKAMAELKRVLAPGGRLLFVTPVGRPRVAFNGNRIYAPRHVVDALAPLRLDEFRLIPDRPQDGGLVEDPDFALADRQDYGCGCFAFTKPA